MQWRVLSDHSLYADRWLDLRLADVELPDGRHLDHRLLRMSASAGAVVLNAERHALLIWRHRFITDQWGWEMPMGMISAGETPGETAAREVEEETGWRPSRLYPLADVQPSAGIMDAAHHLFAGDGATKIGPPADAFESTRIGWLPLSDVPTLIAKREIVSSSTMAALLYLLAAPSVAGQEHGSPPPG